MEGGRQVAEEADGIVVALVVDTQATLRGPACARSESKVDLPNPAGAETSVSGPALPRSICSASRGRETRFGLGAGM